MKKRKIGLAGLLVVVLALSGVAVYQNSEALKGAFGIGVPSFSALCPVSSSLTTIYVKEGASAAGTGTKRSPYDSIASAQAALESDATIDRVCFSGELTGTLDLDGALTSSLVVTAYAADTYLYSSGSLIQLDESGAIETLTISNLDLEGTVGLAPETSLTINQVTLDGDRRAVALWVGSADTVTISNSEIDNADVGVDTTHLATDAVGSLTISNVDFSPVYDTAISAYYLDSLFVSGATMRYADTGVYTKEVASISIEKSSFNGNDGGNYGVMIEGSNVVPATLEFQNNFVFGNGYAFIAVERSGSDITANIYNNSFYNNFISLGFVADMTIANNIVVPSSNSGRVFGSTTYVASATSDYNLFYGDLSAQAPTLLEWQDKTSLDMNSITGDPLFVSSVDDFHVGAGSPAIDAGTSIATVTDDIDEELRTGAYDIGADEY